MGIACHGCSETNHMAAYARSSALQQHMLPVQTACMHLWAGQERGRFTFYQLCYSALDPWPAGSTVEYFASRLVPAQFQLELIEMLGLLPGS